jgi:hypothetical protein
MKIEIQFWLCLPLLPRGYQQVQVEHLSPQSLYQAYLAQPKLSCCSFQGGYGIVHSGQPWNAEISHSQIEYCLDEFWMSLSWLAGLRRILEGEPLVGIPYWEESQAQLKRISVTQLEIVDRHASGQMLYPPIEADLGAFYLQLCQATQSYLDFCQCFETELQAQNCPSALREKIVSEMQMAEFKQALSALQAQGSQFL